MEVSPLGLCNYLSAIQPHSHICLPRFCQWRRGSTGYFHFAIPAIDLLAIYPCVAHNILNFIFTGLLGANNLFTFFTSLTLFVFQALSALSAYSTFHSIYSLLVFYNLFKNLCFAEAAIPAEYTGGRMRAWVQEFSRKQALRHV